VPTDDHSSTQPSDEALMAAYCAGDANGFNALYARHQGKLYRYVLRTVQAPQVASDVFQDTWMKLVQAADSWKAAQLVAPWLYTVARNRALDHIKLFKNQVYETPEIETASDAQLDEDLSGLLHNQRLGAALIAAVEALPLVQREAFLLQTEAGMALEAIAQITDAGIETVKSRLRYARATLKTVLKQGGWHD
jgi:RNA polymerase sigma factor (sigma-70 family)